MSTLHATINPPDKARTFGGLTDADTASAERKPYPVVIGERLVPLLWVGEIYDQRTEAVKQSSGGKKGK